MKNYITEFIGTFFLVLAIGLTGNPIAIGTMLMVMVYMGGHISGAHYNPAVSIAMIFRGLLSIKEAINYILSQLAGAFLAAIFVIMLSFSKRLRFSFLNGIMGTNTLSELTLLIANIGVQF